MIYFDNAATTLAKPEGVKLAMNQALDTFGAAGRGAHEAALAAGLGIYEVREKLSRFFNAPSPAQVVFAANATAALNTAIAGLLQPGNHAITTAASHNSVLRPLYRERKRGATLSIAAIAQDASLDVVAFEKLFNSKTRLVVLTHASNLTGDVYDIARLSALCHERGALLIVDAAQTAGFLPLDMQELGIDVLAFTGHKGLYGPQGIGGLCIAKGVEIEPLMVGGSGMRSFDEEHPQKLPESLEAGTPNGPGIAGLGGAIDYFNSRGVEALAAKVRWLTKQFEEGVHQIDGVRVLGGRGGIDRTGIVALNVREEDSALVSDILANEYDVCTRSGAHCAPLMHTALGTASQGAVRFSFSHANTSEEIDKGLEALASISNRLKGSGL